jgi:hypothetical protein
MATLFERPSRLGCDETFMHRGEPFRRGGGAERQGTTAQIHETSAQLLDLVQSIAVIRPRVMKAGSEGWATRAELEWLGLKASVCGDAAHCEGLLRIDTFRTGNPARIEIWKQVTMHFRLVEGEWRVMRSRYSKVSADRALASIVESAA